ncbi:MAG: RNA-binding transcriptional accessory protein [Clostridia bacterium]|nr:RNA-binding transcriptional accessory protein [Clostridia bacterium]
MEIYVALAKEFNIKEEYSQNLISLLDEGSTIPFIARYRKEMHGSLDDQVIREFADRLTYLRNFEDRKKTIIKSIDEQGKLDAEILKKLDEAKTLTELEDIYRPFKPKRKTRATEAIAKGLEPLALIMMAQEPTDKTLEELARDYISEEKGVASEKEAIAGAMDIIAEKISDNSDLRKELREFLKKTAFIMSVIKKPKESKKKKDEPKVIDNSNKYEDKEGSEKNTTADTYAVYDNFKQEVAKIPSHRILAINRGEKEDFLKVTLEFNKEKCLEIIANNYEIKEGTIFTESLTAVHEDSFDRLIEPSLEREIRSDLTDVANEQAIKNFEINLKPLLMEAPLKGKRILGFDPGYRMGCKLAVIDENGTVLDTAVIYPTKPFEKIDESKAVMTKLISKWGVDVISIGNGTASKESEIFCADLIKTLQRKVGYAVVSEAGASIYSASKLGAEEFPDMNVNLRSAASIARRLQDPLAELIKVDVKSIGVGQYQHDMPQKRLTEVLDGVVEDCVNKVGVDINTASPSLLKRVSGLNEGLAKNIVAYREKNGAFVTRADFIKVPKLGAKAFEQCAGFLRIANGEEILDNTAVHPESYENAKNLLKVFKMTEEDVKNGHLAKLPELVSEYGEEKLASEIGIGVPTMTDIVEELTKPGRDIRDEAKHIELRTDVLSMEDLQVGMVLTGTVRNVIDFGAFVDIGVHQDGLVHISEICARYIKHPTEELTVGQIVQVKVISLDLNKKRIGLSIKKAAEDAVSE